MNRCTCGPRRRIRRLLTIAGRGRVAMLLRYVRRLKLFHGRPRFGEPKTRLVLVRRRPCPLHPCRWIQLPLFEECPLPRRRLPGMAREKRIVEDGEDEWDEEEDD